MSREIKVNKDGHPTNLDDLRYMNERNQVPQDLLDEIDDEDLQKLMRGEKVKIKGFSGKSAAEDELEEKYKDQAERDGYDKWKEDRLRAEVATRTNAVGEPLTLEGGKKELIERLRENDRMTTNA